jgi:hypothetical protein
VLGPISSVRYPSGLLAGRIGTGEAEGSMFGWTYLDGSGEEMGASQRFDDAEAAEEWMGACWQDLLDHGVEEVALEDHARERRLYRMDLSAG